MRGSIRAYARHRGVTHGAVQKAIRANRISLESDGKVDFAAADSAWADNTDLTKPRNSVTGKPKRALPAAPGSGTGPRAGSALDGARAYREHYTARLERLEYEERAGSLVPRADVDIELTAQARTARDLVMGLADRVDAELARITGLPRGECRDVVLKEARTICETIARGEPSAESAA